MYKDKGSEQKEIHDKCWISGLMSPQLLCWGKTGEKGKMTIQLGPRLADKQGCNPFTVGYLLQLLDSHDVPSSKPAFWGYSIYIHFVGLMSHVFPHFQRRHVSSCPNELPSSSLRLPFLVPPQEICGICP